MYYKLYLWLMGMAYTNMGNTCTTLYVHGIFEVMALYCYGPVWLGPSTVTAYIVSALRSYDLCSCGPIWYDSIYIYGLYRYGPV